MNLYLHNELKQHFNPAEPLFEQLMRLQGERYRQLEGRTTYRVNIGNQHYFIKQHRGVGWKEIIKNLLQGRLPVVSAENEKIALEKLQTLSVPVPQILGFGKQGCNPAKRQSFILLQELTSVVSLEDLCRDWLTKPPRFTFKRQLIAEVARIMRIMHEHGINHRDCYICHFLLDTKSTELKLYLIDLHRAQCRHKTPERWLIKDLAGLYFSSHDIGLTRGDYFYFLCQYRNKGLRDILQQENVFWQQVKQRGEQLYRDHHN